MSKQNIPQDIAFAEELIVNCLGGPVPLRRFSAIRAILLVGCLAHLCACKNGNTVPRNDLGALAKLEYGSCMPVSVSGVITYRAQKFSRTYLQTENGAAQLRFEREPDKLGSPVTADVTGLGCRDANGLVILNALASTSTKHLTVQPKSTPVANWGDPAIEGNLVSAEAVVEAAYVDPSGTLAIEAQAQGQPIQASILAYPNAGFEHWRGAVVLLGGVLETSTDLSRRTTIRKLWVQNDSQVEVLSAATPRDIRSISALGQQRSGSYVQLIASLLQPAPAAPTYAQDSTGRAELGLAPGCGEVFGEPVRITGFVTASQGGGGLRNVLIRELPGKGPRPAIHAVAQLRALSPGRANQGIPVSLQGIVTYHDPTAYILFIRDQTGGVFVSFHGHGAPNVTAGDVVQVDGVSGAGDFAPVLRARTIRKTGTAPSPNPGTPNIDELTSGNLDSQMVAVEGIVRSIRTDSYHQDLSIQTGGIPLTVHLGPAVQAEPAHLLDTRVRVQGVAGSVFNDKRQIVGARLFTANLGQISILEPAALIEKQLPLEISNLLRFDPGAMPGHRIKIKGVVTGMLPPATACIRDGSRAVRVRLVEQAGAAVGDVVEAIGYAVAGPFGPMLEETILRKVGRTVPPLPSVMTAREVVERKPEAELIEVEGELEDQVSTGDARVLMLLAGSTPFSARLPRLAAFPALKRGHRLRLRGLCIMDDTSTPAASMMRFNLYLRDPDDLTITRDPPLLDESRAWKGLVILAAIALLMAAWTAALRMKVRGQTRQIRKQLDMEATLKAAAESANRAKSAFLANMSHEIRTPLNAVLGYSRLAFAASQTDEQREDLNTVCESSEALLHLVDDILDFSKIEAGQVRFELKTVDLPKLLRQIRQLFSVRASEKNIQLRLELDADVPRFVELDEFRLRQVLSNLVSNAIKFTAEGSVTCRVRVSGTDGPTVSLVLTVADTGIGIAPERRAAIFEAFAQEDESTTRRFGGTGLGLAICARLVELAGGSLAVDSEVGKGSEFHVRLRVRRLDIPDSEAEDAPKPTCIEGLRVLVAEDNLVNQRLITKLLRRAGCSVLVAGDGSQAVQAFVPDQFDIVLMDLQMPVMDGYEAARQIRAKQTGTSWTPIIALTADVMPEARPACQDAGMNGYVAKPIRIENLVEEMARCLHLQSARFVPMPLRSDDTASIAKTG